jgi:hypothetical protein
MGVKDNMINTKTWVPINVLSKRTGISRQWLTKKAKQGVIRTIKPFEESTLKYYNLEDAMKHFDVVDTK